MPSIIGDDEVVLIGYSIRGPGCYDTKEFSQISWISKDPIKSITEDHDYLREIKERKPEIRAGFVDDSTCFDNDFFEIPDHEVLSMDPHQRLAMEQTILAIQHAGLRNNELSEHNPIVLASSWSHDFERLLPDIDQYQLTGNMGSLVAGRIAHFLNLKGGALGVESACSSGPAAIHLARTAIMSGQTKMAIVIGTSFLGPSAFLSIDANGLLAPNGVLKAFDVDADGYVRAEGFSTLILCSKTLAKQRDWSIHGVISGSTMNSDGLTKSIASPSRTAQRKCQEELLIKLRSKTKASAIDLIVAHGTGTKVGDRVEAGALLESLNNKKNLRVLSPKAAFGHNETCAGHVAIISSVLASKQQYLPAQLHLKMPIESMRGNRMMFIGEEGPVKKSLVNAFGITGTNVNLMIETKQPVIKRSIKRNLPILAISAKNEARFEAELANWIEYLETTAENYEDILYTNSRSAQNLGLMQVFHGATTEAMIKALKNRTPAESQENVTEICYNEEMSLDSILWATKYNLPYAKYLTKVLQRAGLTMKSLSSLKQTSLTLVLQLAWVELLRKIGTLPDIIKGKGIGTLSALVAKNEITVQKALKIGMSKNWEREFALKYSNLKTKANDLNGDENGFSQFEIEVNLGNRILNLMEFENFLKVVTKMENIDLRALGSTGNLVEIPRIQFNRKKFWSIRQKDADKHRTKEIQGISKADLIGIFDSCTYPVHDVDLGTEIDWLYFDSLLSVEFSEKLRLALGYFVDYEDCKNCQTLADLLKMLNANDTKKNVPEDIPKTIPVHKTDIVARDVTTKEVKKSVIHIDSIEFHLPGMASSGVSLHEMLLSARSKASTTAVIFEKGIEHLIKCSERIKVKLNKEDLSRCPFIFATDGMRHLISQEDKTGSDSLLQGNAAIISGRLATQLGVKGMVSVVDNTCTSVHVALDVCMKEMERQQTTYGIVAAARFGSPKQNLEFYAPMTKSYDSDRGGYSPQSVFGIILLKRSTEAPSGTLILNEIDLKFSGSTMSPSYKIIDSIKPLSSPVNYLEMHGTGTLMGDDFETKMAVALMHGQQTVVGSIKSSVGHTEAACGLMQLIKLHMIAKFGSIPHQIHLQLPLPAMRKAYNLRLPFIREEAERKANVNKFAITCYGLSGTVAKMTIDCNLTEKLINTKDYAAYMPFPIDDSSDEAVVFNERLSQAIIQSDISLSMVNFLLTNQKRNDNDRKFTVTNSRETLAKDLIDTPLNPTVNAIVFEINDELIVLDFWNNSVEFKKHLVYVLKKLPRNRISWIVAAAYAMSKLSMGILPQIEFFSEGAAWIGSELANNNITYDQARELMAIFGKTKTAIRQWLSKETALLQKYKLEDTLNRMSCAKNELLLCSSKDKASEPITGRYYKDFLLFFGSQYVEGKELNWNLLRNLTEPHEESRKWLELINDDDACTKDFFLGIEDHVILGENIVPAVVWLRLLIEEFSDYTNIKSATINMKCSASKAQDFYIDRGQIVVDSAPVVSYIVEKHERVSESIVDLAKTSFKNLTRNTATQIYSSFLGYGYQYGWGYKILEEVSFSENSYGIFALNNFEVNRDVAPLEAALQAVVFSVLSQNDFTLVYPFHFEDISLFGEISTATKGYFNYTFKGGLLSSTICLLDVHGKLVISFQCLFKSGSQPLKFMRPSKSSKREHLIKSRNTKIADLIKKEILLLAPNIKLELDVGFFEMGLNSLLITKLVTSLKKIGLSVDLVDLFNYTTITELAEFLDSTISQDVLLSDDLEGEVIEEEDLESDDSTIGRTSPAAIHELPLVDKPRLDEVIVISSSCRLPGSISDSQEFWDSLVTGRNVNSRIPASRIATRDILIRGKKYGKPLDGGYFIEDIRRFDNEFFGISKSEASVMDPQQRILLECVYECLNQGIALSAKKIGVFLGFMGTEYPDLMMERTDALSMLSSAASVLSGRVNYVFGLNGPSITIDTACSSSLIAVEQAVESLKENKCEYAIVAGVNVIVTERGLGQRANGGMLSPNGICNTFDSEANGYARADGCVVLLLTKERPGFYGTRVIDVKSNHCGKGASLTSPNGSAQKELVKALLEGKDPIKIWDAHGTGTKLGDPIEVNVLSELLNQAVVTSAKTAFGHGEAAAGATGFLKASLQLKHQYLPPTLHFSNLNGLIKEGRLSIPVIGQEIEVDKAGISSFGISGTNAAALICRDQDTPCGHLIKKYHALRISAKSQESLDRLRSEYYNWVTDGSGCLVCLEKLLAKQPRYKYGLILLIRGRTVLEACLIKQEIDYFLTNWDISTISDLDLQPAASRWRQQKTSFDLSNALAFTQRLSQAIDVHIHSDDVYLLISLLFQKKTITLQEMLEADQHLLQVNKPASLQSLQSFWKHKKKASIGKKLLELASRRKATTIISTRIEYLMCCRSIEVQTSKQSVNRIPIPSYPFRAISFWCNNDSMIEEDRILGVRKIGPDDAIVYQNIFTSYRFPMFEGKAESEIGWLLALRALGKQNMTSVSLNLKTMNLEGRKDDDVISTSISSDQIHIIIGEKEAAFEISKHDFEGDLGFQALEKAPYQITFEKALGKFGEKIKSVVVHEFLAKTDDVFDFYEDEDQILLAQGDLVYFRISFDEVAGYSTPKQEISRQNSVIEAVRIERTDRVCPNIREAVLELLREVIPNDVEISDDSTFVNLGVDSLGVVDFVNRLNERFTDFEFSTNDVFDKSTVGEFVEFVGDNTGRKVQPEINGWAHREEQSTEIVKEVVKVGKIAATTIQAGKIEAEKSTSKLEPMRFETKQEPGKQQVIKIQAEKLQTDSAKVEEPDVVEEEADDQEPQILEQIVYLISPKPETRSVTESCERLYFNGEEFPELDKNLQGPTTKQVNLQIVDYDRLKVDQISKVFTAFKKLIVSLWKSKGIYHFHLLKSDTLFASIINSALKCVAAEFHPKITVSLLENLVPYHNRKQGPKNLEETKNWLITGGLSGIGFSIAEHLAKRYPVENLVLVSRRKPTDDILLKVQDWRAKVTFLSLDTTDYEALRHDLFKLPFKIDGIIHSAGVCRDALIPMQNEAKFSEVFNPKVLSIENLEKLEKELNWELQSFIVMSSIAAVVGNKGQLNYGISNAVADWMMTERRRKGLQGSTINWGNWLETGMAVNVNGMLSQLGFQGLRTKDALQAFDLMLQEDVQQIVVAAIEWEKVYKHRLDLKEEEVYQKEALLHQQVAVQSPFFKHDAFVSILRSFKKDIEGSKVDGKTVFMFPGQGSYYLGAGQILKKTFQAFDSKWTECVEEIQKLEAGFDMEKESGPGNTLHDQLKAFVFGLASFSLWTWSGVKVDYVIGHSVGEITAVVAAQGLSLQDGIKLIIARASAMDSLKGQGCMIVTDRKAEDLLKSKKDVYLSAFNSDRQVVISGTKRSMAKCYALLKRNGFTVRVVNPDYPFHSPLYDPKKIKEFENKIADIKFMTSQIPIFSTSRAEIMKNLDSKHFAEHLKSPVFFSNCIEKLAKLGVQNWIDCGPGDILANFVRRCSLAGKHSIALTVSAKTRELHNFIKSAAVVLEFEPLDLDLGSTGKLEIERYQSMVDDHKISGQSIMPGVISIANVHSWVQDKVGNDLQLKEIKLLSPWTNDLGNGKIRIGKNGSLEVIAGGRLVLSAKLSNLVQKTEDQTINDSFGRWKVLKTSEFYEEMASRGMSYGSNMKILNHIEIHDKTIKSNSLLKDNDENNREKLLEACLQTVLGWVWQNRDGMACIPVSIENFYLKPDQDAQDFHGNHKILGQIVKNNNHHVMADIVAFDAADRKIARFGKILAVYQSFQKPLIPKTSPATRILNEKPDKAIKFDLKPVQDDPVADKFIAIKKTTEDVLLELPKPVPKAIGIINYSLRFPGVDSTEDLFDAMISTKLPKSHNKYRKLNNVQLLNHDPKAFDAEFFGITPVEAKYVDPQQKLLLELVHETLQTTSFKLPTQTGVFIGCGPSEFAQKALAELEERPPALTTGTHPSALAGRIAHWLKLEGPAEAIDTACSSSIVALEHALRSIQQGVCEAAIVCGINMVGHFFNELAMNCKVNLIQIFHHHNTDTLRNAKMLSPTGSRPFNASTDGYSRSETAVVLILGCPSNQCIATLDSIKLGHSGATSALTVPKTASQLRLMKNLYQDDAEKSTVDLVECHMTGTTLGDPIELEAVHSVLGATISLTGAKALFGHAEPAAGLLSLITVLAGMQKSYIYPIPHLQLTNRRFRSPPNLQFIGTEAKIEKAQINSFGFTGTNTVTLISKPAERQQATPRPKMLYFMILSAKSATSLEQFKEIFSQFVSISNVRLEEIENTLLARTREKHAVCLIYDYRRRLIKEVNLPGRMPQIDRRSALLMLNYGMDVSTFHLPEEFKPKASLEELALGFSKLRPRKIRSFSRIPYPPLSPKIDWPFKRTQGVKSEICWAIDWRPAKATKDINSRVIPIQINSDSRLEAGSTYHLPFTFDSEQISENFEKLQALIRLFEKANTSKTSLIVSRQLDGRNSALEMISTIRTLAKEYRQVTWKLALYDKKEALDTELRSSDFGSIVKLLGGQRLIMDFKKSTSTKITRSYKTILITGGSGGLASRLVEEIQPEYAYLVSRSKPKNLAPDVEWIEADVSDKDKMIQAFSKIKKPIDVAFHMAGVIKNSLSKDLKREDFEAIINPKCLGLQNLLDLNKDSKFKEIVVISSIAAVLGSYGQVAYSFANGMMASMAESSGQNVRIFHLGPIEDIGMLSGDQLEPIRRQIKQGGWEFLTSDEVIYAIFSIEGGIIFKGELGWKEAKKEASVEAIQQKTEKKSVKNVAKPVDISVTSIQSQIWRFITLITEIEEATDKNSLGFMSMGIDSLMIEELREKCQTHFKISLDPVDIFDRPTVNGLSEIIHTKIEQIKEALLEIEDEESPVEDMEATTADVPLPMPKTDTRIAIIGYSGSLSGSRTVDEFWERLKLGEELIHRQPSDLENYVIAGGIAPGHNEFDYEFWNVPKEEADSMDPQLRVFLQHAYRTLEMTGIVKKRRSLNIGVYAGAEPSDYFDSSKEAEGSLVKMFRQNMKDFLATWTSYNLDLNGPAIGIYSACSTFYSAIHEASQSLKLGKIDLALVGASSLALPEHLGYEYQPGMVLSKNGDCRPFSLDAGGTVRGSSVGVICLQRLDKAVEHSHPIHAIIQSIGISNDGSEKASFMAPNSSGQELCIRRALDGLTEADVSRIKVIECHGTGTKIGDAMELKAMRPIYGDKEVYIGSVKANAGHGFAGAGFASLMKIMKTLETGIIVPQINCLPPGEAQLGGMKIPLKLERLEKPFFAASSSFGIGGTNVHIVLDGPVEYQNSQTTGNTNGIHLLPLSARTPESCVLMAKAIVEYLKQEKSSLSSISSTLQFKREIFSHRISIFASSKEEAISKLEKITENDIRTTETIDATNIAFLFAPQGVQRKDMLLRDFSNRDLCFASTIRESIEECSKVYGNDFREVLYPSKENTLIEETRYSQTALYILEMSIAAQLKKWGIAAVLVAGHSLGEYSALAYSGALDQKQLLPLLKTRGELCQSTPAAKMIAVKGTFELPPNIEISAYLDEGFYCIVGPSDDMDAFEKTLAAQKIDFKKIRTQHGFHSSMLESIMEAFRQKAAGLNMKSLKQGVISNVDGQILDKITPDYLVNHMRQPVRLDKTVEKLQEKRIRVVVQIGPASISELLLKKAGIHSVRTVPAFRDANPKMDSLYQTICDLWSLGFDLDFMKINQNPDLFDPFVPTYQFKPSICWLEKKEAKSSSLKLMNWIWDDVKLEQANAESLVKHYLLISNSSENDISSMKLELRTKADVETSVHEIARKLQAQNYDSLVYFLKPEDDFEGNCLAAYYFPSQLCRLLPTTIKILVIVPKASPETWIALGPLRERILKTQQENCYFIEDHSTNCNANRFLSIARTTSKSSIFRLFDDQVQSLRYGEFADQNRSLDIKNVLVIGGSGALACHFIRAICRGKKVTIWSRKATENKDLSKMIEELKDKSNFLVEDVDITDANQVKQRICNLKNQGQVPDLILYCAGIEPSSSIEKTWEDSLKVIKPKMLGLQNVVNGLKDLQIKVKKLIIASSLSSVLSLQGTQEYAAANLFCDALSINPPHCFDDVLSIQWPSWKGSGMSSKLGQSANDLLDKGSITVKEGINVFMKALSFTGCLGVSQEDPFLLRFKIIDSFSRPSDRLCIQLDSSDDPREKIRSLWRQILSLKQVDDDTNFFSSGGHSLLALQLVWAIRDNLGLTISETTIMETPNFKDFVEKVLSDHGEQGKKINIISKVEKLPLSYAQENMYLLYELKFGSKYNIVFTITFDSSKINGTRLNFAFQRLIAEQESFRTVFKRDSAGIYQETMSLTESFYKVFDRDQETGNNYIKTMIDHKFDIFDCCMLIRSEVDDYKAKITFSQHHIITDGWSMTVLANTLTEAYKHLNGQGSISDDKITLADFANYQRQLPLERDLEKLITIIDPTSYTALTSMDISSIPNKEPKFRRVAHFFEQKILGEIRKLSRTWETTEFTVMVAALAMVLRRWQDEDGSDRVVIGSPVSGRHDREVQNMIGYFLNNIVISLDIRLEDNLNDVIPKAKEAVTRAMKYQHIPFHLLVQRLKVPRSGRQPLFNVYFNFRYQLDFPRVQIEDTDCPVEHNSMNSVFDLSLTIDDTQKGYRLLIEHNLSAHPEEMIDSFRDGFLQIFTESGQEPINLFTGQQKKFPAMTPIAAFTKQAARSLNKLAIWQNLGNRIDEKTYKELIDLTKSQAQSISKHYWIQKGMNPRNDSVCFIKNDMNTTVITSLAVTLLGMAYAPVDPTTSDRRLKEMTNKCTGSILIPSGIIQVPIQQSTRAMFNQSLAEDLLYVIHTSGSTGVPKSVPISNRNYCCFISDATRQVLLRSRQRVSHSVNTVFDMSKLNYWGAWLNGGALICEQTILDCPLSAAKGNSDFLFLPSAVYNSLPSKTLRLITEHTEILVAGGESVSDHQLEKSLLAGQNFYQIYGPSEATIWSAVNRCRLGEISGTLLGAIVANEEGIIKRDQKRLGSFQKGELILKGPKVARGYINDPEKSKVFNGNEYNTGDLVFGHPNGKLRYFARRDRQIKMNGVRVDLHQVEQEVIKLVPDATVAVVSKIENQLICFLDSEVVPRHLKIELAHVLPSASIPSVFHGLSQIPKNQNGKVDMEKLKEIYLTSKLHVDQLNQSQNLDRIESIILEIAIELLKKQVSLLDNFFDQGGHSLLVLQFADKLSRKLGMPVDHQNIFKYPRFSDLADSIRLLEQNKGTEVQIITALREVKGSKYNVYAIHAIGGSIFPYFALLRIFPEDISVYAIDYKINYPAKNFDQLSDFYTEQIARHTGTTRPFILGHSLGGTLSREVIIRLNQKGFKIQDVVMLDTWKVAKRALKTKDVTSFIEETFKGVPNIESIVQKAQRLSDMIREHDYIESPWPRIHLFKAEILGMSALKNSVRADLTEEMVRSMRSNGLQQLTMNPVEVHLVPGNHEAMMSEENLMTVRDEILRIAEIE